MFSSNTTQVSDGGYQIQRSLRFNPADSAYLDRTPATATNRRTWTWSAWIKRSGIVNISADWRLFESRPSGYTIFDITNSAATYPNSLRFLDDGGAIVQTTPLYRDVSAWYHIVLAVDTTQATNSNRVKIYVNGVQVTSFTSSTYPTLNYETQINTTNPQVIGRDPAGGGAGYYDGYMTEINFIDGQQLTPSSFGETNADTGIWQPKAYSGSYGTNGFELNFSDNSNTTAATLGKDYSGNGNNWTPNNFSVTAGAGNDSLVDSPTSYGTDTGVGGTVRGNYCTWNPLRNDQSAVLTNGNLDLSTAGSGNRYGAYTTLGVSSGKWYWEITAGSLSTDGYNIGITSASKSPTSALGSDAESYIYLNTANKRTSATTVAYGATYTAGDVIGVALDLDVGTLTFYKNGTSQGTAYTSIPSNTWFPTVTDNDTGSTTGSSFIGNFGQRPFAYTAPSGFKALCTQNLPTPTIGATTATLASQYFNPVTFSGNNSTNAITVGFAPDFAWVKSRSNAFDHNLSDIIRGNSKILRSNTTGSESTYTDICVFGSNGVTLNANSDANAAGTTSIGWFWKGGGAGSTNTAGSITSTVSANTTSGFSVVTYTGTGANATVGHGLGVAPSMVIVKRRNSAEDWQVRHISIAAVNSIELNLTGGASSSPTTWNSTNPTSTVFSIGTDTQVNASGGTYVAYCFAPIAGYSSMGSYVGNGSTDGPFIFTGMRPAFVLVRRSDGSDDWYIFDNKRIAYNVRNEPLYANVSAAEGSGFNYIDLLSNGFKMRNNSYENVSGATYIFMAFAEVPQKFSLAR